MSHFNILEYMMDREIEDAYKIASDHITQAKQACACAFCNGVGEIYIAETRTFRRCPRCTPFSREELATAPGGKQYD